MHVSLRCLKILYIHNCWNLFFVTEPLWNSDNQKLSHFKRPQHLKDCTSSISAGDASTSLLTSLTELVNHLTNGHLPTALQPFLYGAQLHGLRKNNGDLRPIAVGCTYRHLVAKVCLRPYISRLCELLQPSQLGVGTPGLWSRCPCHMLFHDTNARWKSFTKTWC